MSLDLLCYEEIDFDTLDSEPIEVEEQETVYTGVLSSSEGILDLYDWDNGPVPTEYYLDLHDNFMFFGVEE